ncbi:MAG: hypothetical protein PHR16_05345 [Methylovulum sp.]|nr:hypothetical protein [Methylovulum sp.]
MILSKEESKLFYDLTWSLHFYINKKLGIIPNIQSIEDYIGLEVLHKILIINALYKQIALIDDYVNDNPENFSVAELAQVQSWKHFVKDRFYIERHLKNHSIFIDSKDKVYAVVGLTQAISDIIHKSYLPHMTDAVLLPFANKIIYDGLLSHYSVSFGRGITGGLKDIYLRAKANGDIIGSLTETAKKPPVAPKMIKNWQPEIQDLKNIAQGLRGGQGQPALYSPVFGLIKAAIALGEVTTSVPQDNEALWKAYDRVERALNNTERYL